MIGPVCMRTTLNIDLKIGFLILGFQDLDLNTLYASSIAKYTSVEALTCLDELLNGKEDRVSKFKQIYEKYRQEWSELFHNIGVDLQVSPYEECYQKLVKNPYIDSDVLFFDSRRMNTYSYFKGRSCPINCISREIDPIQSTSSNPIQEYVQETIEKIISCNQRESNSLEDEGKSRKLGKSEFVCRLLSVKRIKPFQSGSNSGIYIQYTYARLCGIKKSLQSEGLDINDNLMDPEILAQTPKVVELLKVLEEYDQIFAKHEASVMVGYLVKLSSMISSIYYHFRVKGEAERVWKTRWTILRRCHSVLENGLGLIGLELVGDI